MGLRKLFRPKSNVELAEEIHNLRQKRIKAEGRANLIKLRDIERTRIEKARKTGTGSNVMRGVDNFFFGPQPEQTRRPRKTKRTTAKKRKRKPTKRRQVRSTPDFSNAIGW